MVVKKKRIVVKRKKKADELQAVSEEMIQKQLEFYQVKQQKKLIENREKELKAELDPFMAKAFKPDASGHFLFTTVNENGEKIHLQKQARKKIELNQERAMEFLSKKPKWEVDAIEDKEEIAPDVTMEQVLDVLAEHAPHLLEKRKVVNEDVLKQLVLSEEITMEEFESMCDISVNYAMTYIDDKKLQEHLANSEE